MQTLPIRKAIGATFAFILHHWQDVLRIVWAPVTLLEVGSVLIAFGLSGVQAGAPNIATPEQALAALSAGMPLLIALILLNVYAFLVTYAGLLKLLIRGERPKLPFYLGFGADEQRLLGCSLLVAGILIGVYFAAAIIAGLIASFAVALDGRAEPSSAVTSVIIIFVLGVSAWFGARLFLAMPATVALNRIGVGASWSRTKGATAPIFLYLLFWLLLGALLQAGFIALTEPGYFDFMASMFSGAGLNQANMPAPAELGSAPWLLNVVLSFVMTLLIYVFGVAAPAVAWRLLTDQEQRATP